MTSRLEERIKRWDLIADRYCREATIRSGRLGGRLVRAWVRDCVVHDFEDAGGVSECVRPLLGRGVCQPPYCRRSWRTRLELSSAIFEYVEIFHNRRRRDSSLGMLTPRHPPTA